MDGTRTHDEDLDGDGAFDATITVTERHTDHAGERPGDDLEITTVEEVDLDGDGHADIVATTTTTYLDRDHDGVVIGFATAITDHRFAAYIPLVEVRPEHQRRRIGTEIVRALLDRLGTCYMVDLVCDDEVVPFYERLGGARLNAVAWRNHDRLHTGE